MNRRIFPLLDEEEEEEEEEEEPLIQQRLEWLAWHHPHKKSLHCSGDTKSPPTLRIEHGRPS